jgi:predicted RND superfamily exporter protein
MLAAIVILCAIAQRSLRLLSLNLLALVLAFCIYVGLLLLTGAALTPLSVISVPLLIGLAIDYSLHILMTLEHEGGDLRRTFDHLAAPVVLTGLSASIGFGAPMLTSQPALRNFGLVMDLGVVSSVVACLVFLPCFYMVCRKVRHPGNSNSAA